MILSPRVSGVFEVIGAFLWREGLEQLADCRAEGLNGARGAFSQQVFQLGKDLFDWAVKNPWSLDPVVAQGGQEGRGPPPAVRDLGVEPHAAGRPSPQRRHVGLGPGLVDEDQALRLDPALILGPLRPPTGDVGTIALAGRDAFF